MGDQQETEVWGISGAPVVSGWQRSGQQSRGLGLKSRLCFSLNLRPRWNTRISAYFHFSICRDGDIRDFITLGCSKNCMSQINHIKFLINIMLRKWSNVSDVAQSCPLRPHGLYPTRLLCPCDFLGKGPGVGCHFLLQGIFPTQGSNLGRPHCRQTLYHQNHQGILVSTYY